MNPISRRYDLVDHEAEKGIPIDFMIDKIKKAIVTACKNSYGNEDVVIDMDPDKGQFDVFLRKQIVEEVDPDDGYAVGPLEEPFEAGVVGVEHAHRGLEGRVMDVGFVDETGVPGCYVVADVLRVAADLPEVLDVAVDMPEAQLCLVGDLGYELEIGQKRLPQCERSEEQGDVPGRHGQGADARRVYPRVQSGLQRRVVRYDEPVVPDLLVQFVDGLEPPHRPFPLHGHIRRGFMNCWLLSV